MKNWFRLLKILVCIMALGLCVYAIFKPAILIMQIQMILPFLVILFEAVKEIKEYVRERIDLEIIGLFSDQDGKSNVLVFPDSYPNE